MGVCVAVKFNTILNLEDNPKLFRKIIFAYHAWLKQDEYYGYGLDIAPLLVTYDTKGKSFPLDEESAFAIESAIQFLKQNFKQHFFIFNCLYCHRLSYKAVLTEINQDYCKTVKQVRKVNNQIQNIFLYYLVAYRRFYLQNIRTNKSLTKIEKSATLNADLDTYNWYFLQKKTFKYNPFIYAGVKYQSLRDFTRKNNISKYWLYKILKTQPSLNNDQELAAYFLLPYKRA